MIDEPASTTPGDRRWVPLALYVAAALLAAFAVYGFGGLSTTRAFALAQPQGPGPNPFEANYLRYAVAVLWPLPAAALLVVSGAGFGRGRPRWWIPLILAGVWLAAYYVVKPPQTYYYWLWPVPPK